MVPIKAWHLYKAKNAKGGTDRRRQRLQNPVTGAITLPPFTSRVLIDNGPAEDIFADDFETGDLSQWSSNTAFQREN